MTWKNEDININGTSSAKCPNCGASVFFNEKLGKLFCAMCGGLYDPESMKPAGRIENRDTGEAGSEEDNKQEFVCNSCGAAVVTDYNTSATFCAFCGVCSARAVSVGAGVCTLCAFGVSATFAHAASKSAAVSKMMIHLFFIVLYPAIQRLSK